MKKYIILSILSLALAVSMTAQDARQRSTDTIVADVLAAMPAATAGDQAVQMADLASAAPSSVVKVASMLKPAGPGVKNNVYEYALTGLSAYASATPSVRTAVCLGFVEAIKATSDKTNRNFLLTQLRPLATLSQVPFLKELAQKDSDLAPMALGTLVNIQGSDSAILELVKGSGVDRSLLADAVARKGLACAEPVLLDWASSSEGHELGAVCAALAEVGSSASLETLRTASPAYYASLAVRLADGGNDKAVAKAAKVLLASEVSAFKSAGALAQMKNNPAGALKTLSAALGSSDVQFRNAVLEDAAEVAGKEAVASFLQDGFAKFPSGVKVDALNWFGSNAVHTASSLVASAVSDPACASEAIVAAGKLGGEDCLAALASQLAGPNADKAAKALKSFKGDIQDAMAGALAACPADAESLAPIVNLIGGRRLSGLAPMIFKLAGSSDDAVATLGRSALPGVVTASDIEKVAALLDKAATDVTIEQYSKALSAAISTLPTAEQGAMVSSLMKNASAPSNFYKVLSSTCSDEAVKALAEAFSQKPDEKIVDALATVYNYNAAPVLLDIAKQYPQFKDKAINAFSILVAAFETNPDKKVGQYAQALGIAGDPAVLNEILVKVRALPTMKAFNLAGKYLDREDLKFAAADAVRKIASVTREELDYNTLKDYLGKAAKAYSERGLADDEYAVKEIENILGEAEPSPVSQLTPQEKKQGFEMLFDGTNLDNFQGDKEGYLPMNGAIYVSANYGSTGNLYTLKEYRNFVLRFEFCFLRPGVNNGVGIRTPMGVDAAYEGMCECQILDHDADIYAGWLRDYQVHGSVYGVIPAKRLVHKPLGEWSTEEIRVEGDRIKVTVNGEVIVDGDIRKACKGHNVAPDGSSTNPYTADHRNHPGMFNKKGYVSFCGHGEGLKIRNVRILDLDR